MEEPGMRVVRPANTDGTINPNHLIIWLDKHIGKSNQCALLKREFFMISDPTTNCDRELQNKDINNNICSNDVMPVKVDGVQFVLRTFDDPSKCYEAIKNNQDKHLFFITSGSKGKIIVPQLVSKFQLKLLREHNIYVFCANMNMTTTPGAEEPTNDWALDYSEHILMYDHEDELLARVVLDIGETFFAEGEKLDIEGQLNDALQHFNWSRLMFERSEKTSNRRDVMKNEIEKTNKRINDLEKRLQSMDDTT